MSNCAKACNEALGQSEERFRDLFDEAPIAYVHEGLDSRFIQANQTAMRILGLKPEEVVGPFGRSLVPDIRRASAAEHRGARLSGRLEHRSTDTSGVVLEMRRKDNGNPVWVQWCGRSLRRVAITLARCLLTLPTVC